MPVRAFTSAVFPWSMCPAVPTMTDFIEDSIVVSRRSSVVSSTIERSQRPAAVWWAFRPPIGSAEGGSYFRSSPYATIGFPSPYESVRYSCPYSGAHPGARPHVRRVRKNQAIVRRTRTHAHRTGHLQRDVE